MTGRAPKILLLPIGGERVASVRYRVLAHRPALDAAGFVTRLREPLGEASRGLVRRGSRLLDLARDAWWAGDHDVVFIHRKTYPPPFARRLRRPGRLVVFDLDDALDLPPPGTRQDPAVLLRYRRNFEATTAVAHLVVCGNQELTTRVGRCRLEILATPIDTQRFHPGAVAPPDGPSVGWVGHSDNVPYLEGLADVFRELARRHPGFRVIAVSDRPPSIPGVAVEFRRWTLEGELSSFGGIGIGVMPLEDTPWARAKCAFKAIQYMALGIPTVASPVGMNREVIRDGVNGLLAGTPEAWLASLDSLVSDPRRAREIGEEGRRTVEERYSLAGASRRLVSILQDALGISRGGGKA